MRRPETVIPKWAATILIAAIAIGLASAEPKADSSIIYKCKKADDKLIYSDAPCAEQDAKKLKVLRTDGKQRNVSESKYDPAENPANRGLTREERRRYFIPDAAQSENLTYLKKESATEGKVPAPEVKQKPAPDSGSWMSRMIASIKRFFGN